jgi:hypothetical protein
VKTNVSWENVPKRRVSAGQAFLELPEPRFSAERLIEMRLDFEFAPEGISLLKGFVQAGQSAFTVSKAGANLSLR